MNILVFIYTILAILISPAVSMLFNNSLSEGIFPECFKSAKIIQIFKSGDANSIVNYRSITMLNILSKIFEKLMCARLNFYLKSNNILCINQFCFRKNSNTSDVIIEFLDYVCSSLDSKQISIAVNLDCSKAFNTVNYNILMSKILHNGIRGVMQSWFQSYLINRIQYVSIKNLSASISNKTLVVQEGQALGPLLFLQYIYQ